MATYVTRMRFLLRFHFAQRRRSQQILPATGISLSTDAFYAIGTALEVTITISEPAFKASGHVAWCIPGKNNRFRTGLVFDDPATAYAVRMIEQICHIEQYRHEIEKSEGRHLTQEAAALEWVMRFAKDFPTLSGIAHS